MISFIKSGLFTTVQDLGRTGYQRFGMPVSGAMDTHAARLANILVGNRQGEGVLECTFAGPSIRFETANFFALAGGDFGALLNGEPVAANCARYASAGDVLELPAAVTGARAYIAFAGGLDIKPVMGSVSTTVKTGVGGLEGRALKAGDTLRFRAPKEELPLYEERVAPKKALPEYSSSPVVHFTYGPQADMFSEAGKLAFVHSRYTLGVKSDRMGFRFDGPAVSYKEGADGNIISDGIVSGAIQVPGGKPIVMMAERQTTGGYAKIGAVIAADMPVVAQLKPGDTVRFCPVSVAGAQSWLKRQNAVLDGLEARWNYETQY